MEKDINIHNMYVVRLSKIFIKIVYFLLFIGYADEKKIYRKNGIMLNYIVSFL